MLPFVTCKDGVTLNPTDPGGMVIQAACVLASGVVGLPLEITCGSEGHPPGDPHTLGRARDLHVTDFTASQILALIAALEASFKYLAPGAPFTIMYEVPPGTTTDMRLVNSDYYYENAGATAAHLHIQVKKGQTYPPASA